MEAAVKIEIDRMRLGALRRMHHVKGWLDSSTIEIDRMRLGALRRTLSMSPRCNSAFIEIDRMRLGALRQSAGALETYAPDALK